MEEYIDVIKESIIFKGLKEEEIKGMFGCLSAYKKAYKAGEYVFRNGERINGAGIILSGEALIIKEDYWGNQTILQKLMPGDLFGEVFAILGTNTSQMSVIVQKDSAIMFIDMNKLINVCTSACEFHNRVVHNMVFALALKNNGLNQKINHLTQKKTRDKLMSFLSEQATINGSNKFKIPYNRQQLADYLSVDRSAMSSELSKMKNERIIDFDKNTFCIIGK